MQCLHYKPESNQFLIKEGEVRRVDCESQGGKLLRLLSELRSRIRPLYSGNFWACCTHLSFLGVTPSALDQEFSLVLLWLWRWRGLYNIEVVPWCVCFNFITLNSCCYVPYSVKGSFGGEIEFHIISAFIPLSFPPQFRPPPPPSPHYKLFK
jgi:hypothetical protein